MLGAVLAASNSKEALILSKLSIHIVQLDPCNWVDLTPKIGEKNKPFFVGLIRSRSFPISLENLPLT